MKDAPGDPIAVLSAGARILEAVLGPAGFVFSIGEAGRHSSGGAWAAGAFAAGDKRLELHVRDRLGLVAYHVGKARLGHADYRRSLGVAGAARYPGVGAEPLAAFADLAADLERFCADFVHADGAEVRRFAAALAADPGRFHGLAATDAIVAREPGPAPSARQARPAVDRSTRSEPFSTTRFSISPTHPTAWRGCSSGDVGEERTAGTRGSTPHRDRISRRRSTRPAASSPKPTGPPSRS